MDRTGEHHIKRNKPDSERQMSHVFSHMENLDLKRHESRKGTIWEKEVRVGGRKREGTMCAEYDQSEAD
jgi:hypothetical protein